MKKKLSDKDLKDWNKFIKSKDKINPKDELNTTITNKNKSSFVIDLHGYSLDQANKFVEKTINECFEKKIPKLNVITGKGMRSKSAEDPYKSLKLFRQKNFNKWDDVELEILENLKIKMKLKKINN